jgi:hypothetical protein
MLSAVRHLPGVSDRRLRQRFQLVTEVLKLGTSKTASVLTEDPLAEMIRGHYRIDRVTRIEAIAGYEVPPLVPELLQEIGSRGEAETAHAPILV